MTNKEAIGILSNYYAYCNLTSQVEQAQLVALKALQEREERSKGCEFCDGTERSMLFRKGACDSMNDDVYVSGDAIIIDYGCKVYDTVKIGFCPMCGRPLKGVDND